MSGPRVAWSCVLDDHGPIWDGFKVWTASLIASAGVPAADLVVHHVAPLRPDIAAFCERLSLRTVAVDKFDPRSPHSNKVQQCATDFSGFDLVALTDADLAFMAPLPMGTITAPVAGKPVDFPRPPIDILRQVFDQAGLAQPDAPMQGRHAIGKYRTTTFDTFPANFNGGLYILEQGIVDAFGKEWEARVRWLMDEGPDLGEYSMHVDQIGFSMAVHVMDLETQILDERWNMPSHVGTTRFGPAPYIVHHHGRLDANLGLKPFMPPKHRRLVARTNAKIAAFLAQYDVPVEGAA